MRSAVTGSPRRALRKGGTGERFPLVALALASAARQPLALSLSPQWLNRCRRMKPSDGGSLCHVTAKVTSDLSLTGCTNLLAELGIHRTHAGKERQRARTLPAGGIGPQHYGYAVDRHRRYRTSVTAPGRPGPGPVTPATPVGRGAGGPPPSPFPWSRSAMRARCHAATRAPVGPGRRRVNLKPARCG